MATFGQTSVSASSGSDLHTLITIGKYTLSEAGDVSKLSLYFNNQYSGHKACNMKGIIYAADGASGAPNTRKAVSPAVAIADNKAAGWVDFEFSSAVSLGAGDYWLGAVGDADAVGITAYHGGSSGGSLYLVVGTYSSPEATCPSPPMATGTEKLCVYATYTASGSKMPLLNHLLLG